MRHLLARLFSSSSPFRSAPGGLIVPLSAIYSRAGGDSTVVKLVGKKRTRVAVLVEATGDGVARVSPAKTSSIREGDVVIMGVK